ncbi:MAG TPA: hypothetical protein VN862_02475 [Candidatus Acidoferrales bacterium]|nr:hypothetical protein [Candidatus Acidoferrales bacterium]
MFDTRTELLHSKGAKAFAFAVGAVGLGWVLSRWIVSEDLRDIIFVAVAGIAIPLVIAILNDWRRGLYAFLVWLVFEDLIRKFLGNNLAMFFAKDAIVAVTYAGMLIALRHRKFPMFRAPFFLWLAIFFWAGVLQVFNPNSPSILYGLLGLKLYFYYVPLMFAGYALIRTESDLYKFLTVNLWIGLVVSGLGVAQSILGLNFLSPPKAELAPELRELGHEVRESPITHMRVERVTSVFVSDGRFGQFLTLFFVIAFGAMVYFLLRGKRGRTLVFPAMAAIVLATILAGARGPFVYLIANALILSAALFWGAPLKRRQTAQIGKAVRRAAILAGAAILLMVAFYPKVILARWAFYSETLMPNSSSSEFGFRAWDYPEKNLESVFSQPNWKLGNGIGTAGLGIEYIVKVLGTPPPPIGSESGIGTLILELGIIGPFLWLAWSVSLVLAAWKVVHKLKQTVLFPIGFAFFWYAVFLILIGTLYGLDAYENYLMNAYLWLMVGVLFRLPHLLGEKQNNGHAAAAIAR